MNTFQIDSEYAVLKTAIIGQAEGFCEGEEINSGMKKYYRTKDSPKKKKIFVGIGIRTSKSAVSFLKKHFGIKYRIVPIYLADHEETIHLDMVFNIFGNGWAVIYKKGIRKIPKIISKNYKLIPISKQEKENGGANILPVAPNVVLVRRELKRLRKIVQKTGVKCLCVDFDETRKTGTGGPRCAILPLVRE